MNKPNMSIPKNENAPFSVMSASGTVNNLDTFGQALRIGVKALSLALTPGQSVIIFDKNGTPIRELFGDWK